MFVAKPGSLITKCPSHYAPAKPSKPDLMAPLGRAALLLAFGLVLYALVAGSYAAWKRRRRLALSAQNALLAAFPVTLVAAVILFVALGRRDMTFVYVWQHTSHKLPLGYALSAFWGGQEGSLLLWLLVLTGYAGLAVWLNRRSRELIAWTVPVFGLVAVFFAFMLCFVSSPFNVQPAPPDGQGMVPSLQNPYMLAHPPMLYLGYVGLTVPFAFAMGALLSGRTDERWIVATRRWTLAAWMFLGVGQLIGSHWAYVEIGWGGYYAWDPVENAALMPWLAATAFLHSVMIQEKRGMLKVWNMILVALAFNLSLFGTFLTRSGVIDSIHSFAKSSIGGWFLGFLGLMVVLGRPDPLAPAAAADEDEARVARVARGDVPVQQPAARRPLPDDPVGRPLPDSVCGGARRDALGLEAVLRLLPAHVRAAAAPADGDRAARGVAEGVAPFARQDVRDPVRVAAATGVVLLALGFGSSWPGLLAYTFCAFVAASIVLEFVRGRARPACIFRLSDAIAAATAATSSTPRCSCSRSASPARARTRPSASSLEARAVDRGRRLHSHVHRAQGCEGPELHRLPGPPRGVRPRGAIPSPRVRTTSPSRARRPRRRSTTTHARSATSSRRPSSPGSTRTGSQCRCS